MNILKPWSRVRGCIAASSVVGALGLGSAVSYAGDYSLRLDGRAPIAGMLCDDLAYSEGQRFKEFIGDSFNGFEFVEAHCRTSDPVGVGTNLRWNIQISYRAVSELPTVATDMRFDYYPVGYKLKSDCEKVLPVEAARFTRLTGLPVFASICKTPRSSSQVYTVSVMGFGNTTVRPFTGSFEVYAGLFGHTEGTFKNMFVSRMAADHLEVGEFTRSKQATYYVYSFTYYGKEQIRLTNDTVGLFDKPEHCMTEVSNVERAMTESAVKQYAVVCTKPALPGTVRFELVVVANGARTSTIISPETTYDTFEACQLEKANVINHYKTQLHRDIRGGICSLKMNSRSYVVVMFENL
jgi:hypothetical protein